MNLTLPNPQATLDILIKQGSDYPLTLELTDDSGVPLPLTGYTVAAVIRPAYGDPNITVAFTALVTIPLAGTISLSLTAAQTALLTFINSPHVYDVKMTSPGGVVTPLVGGLAVLIPGVS